MAVASESYAPSVLVSTEGLPEKDWLEYRRRGIGGSDAAAILGISPFATARDLYYDKLKIVPFDDSESNWVAKKMGHLLEDLVAEIFHVKTGYRIYQIKKMFYHPVHTFMLADIDYFVELPGGRTAILEIKTTNYNAKDHWWSEDGQEIIPLNYEAQGRHYMAVMNIDEVFYCCLYGNNEDEVIIRHIDRDRDYFKRLQNRGLSNKTARDIGVLLKTIFKVVKKKCHCDCPGRDVELPAYRGKKIEVFSDHEIGLSR